MVAAGPRTWRGPAAVGRFSAAFALDDRRWLWGLTGHARPRTDLSGMSPSRARTPTADSCIHPLPAPAFMPVRIDGSAGLHGRPADAVFLSPGGFRALEGRHESSTVMVVGRGPAGGHPRVRGGSSRRGAGARRRRARRQRRAGRAVERAAEPAVGRRRVDSRRRREESDRARPGQGAGRADFRRRDGDADGARSEPGRRNRSHGPGARGQPAGALPRRERRRRPLPARRPRRGRPSHDLSRRRQPDVRRGRALATHRHVARAADAPRHGLRPGVHGRRLSEPDLGAR